MRQRQTSALESARLFVRLFMPTLYVENVPEDLYEALRSRAKCEGRSIASEVLNLLAENIPPQEERARRRQIFEFALSVRGVRPGRTAVLGSDHPDSSESMLRADRSR